MPQYLDLYLAIPQVQKSLGADAPQKSQASGGGEIEGHMAVIEELLQKQANK